ncbi:MAG: hypothetical protein P4L69_10860 [Desulfosporosinus sp.]|nr:hypothetical protein [Desulfosporosinus sp.]
MILKKCARPRMHKAELVRVRRERDNDNVNISRLKQAEAALEAKHCRLEDAINALDQNERMVRYLKEKGVMDAEGNMKV